MYYLDVKKGGFYISKTYSFELKKKVVQLYIIIDLFNREAAANATVTKQDIDLVFRAVQSLKERGFAKRAILHSDQGFQFTNPRYRANIEELGLTKSMSSRVNCWDNACIENFFSHLKTELHMFRSLRTEQEIHDIVDLYIFCYNKNRIQTKLNSMPEAYRLKVA